MKRGVVLILACLILSSTTVTSQTRRRSTPKRSASVSKAEAEKTAVEKRAGRERVATQIKILTQFLYLFGGITKGIASVDEAARSSEASTTTIGQNERNKAKVKESIRNVREGLDKLETYFHSNPRLKSYYSYVAGVARTCEAAENQAAANRFDEAGRLLLKAVGQLADALAAMQ